MSDIEISVIMPLFNSREFLRLSLQSFEANRFPGVELIVVDDGSTDESVSIVEDAGLAARIIQQENRGPSAARNRGIAVSRGRYVTFLDSDDIWAGEALSGLHHLLLKNPGASVAKGMVETITEADISPKIRHRARSEPYFSVNLGSALYRREICLELEGFEETINQGEDTDFWMRLWERNVPLVKLPKTVLYYRLHSSNLITQAPNWQLASLRVFKRHRDRMSGATSQPKFEMARYLGDNS